MKFRVSIILFLLAAITISATAQQVKIKPGQIQAGFSVGLVPTYVADVTTTIVPPMSATVDVFLSPNFSLGGFVAYSKVSGESVYANAGLVESFVNQTWMTGLRTTMHSNDLNDWRVYGGFSIGATLPSIDKTVELLPGENMRDDDLPSFSRPAENGFLFSGYVGTRRYLNKNWSAYGEVGFGISLVNIGLAHKF
ncbi:hypothetical protein [Lewinella sp. LCG006]|uniref:hypothetical protein n=1 Tax=Lewinella sp. LCG006 TaxID=3231911 RepID=UPI00345F516E